MIASFFRALACLGARRDTRMQVHALPRVRGGSDVRP